MAALPASAGWAAASAVVAEVIAEVGMGEEASEVGPGWVEAASGAADSAGAGSAVSEEVEAPAGSGVAGAVAGSAGSEEVGAAAPAAAAATEEEQAEEEEQEQAAEEEAVAS